jgi:hypothetical protein
MKRRWSIILPVVGLAAFASITEQAYRIDATTRLPLRYVYWSGMRLDRQPQLPPPPYLTCSEGAPCAFNYLTRRFIRNDSDWGHEYRTPLYPELLGWSAFPVFLLSGLLISGLGRLGVSHVWTFFIVMPPALSAWYYFLGWTIDRRRYRRQLRQAVP